MTGVVENYSRIISHHCLWSLQVSRAIYLTQRMITIFGEEFHCYNLWHLKVGKPFGCGSVWLTRENPRKVTLLWLTSEIYYFISNYLQRSCTDRVFRVINHPDYIATSDYLDLDISLLRLPEPVDFNNPALSHVFPACWPSSEPVNGTRVHFQPWWKTGQ